MSEEHLLLCSLTSSVRKLWSIQWGDKNLFRTNILLPSCSATCCMHKSHLFRQGGQIYNIWFFLLSWIWVFSIIGEIWISPVPRMAFSLHIRKYPMRLYFVFPSCPILLLSRPSLLLKAGGWNRSRHQKTTLRNIFHKGQKIIWKENRGFPVDSSKQNFLWFKFLPFLPAGLLLYLFSLQINSFIKFFLENLSLKGDILSKGEVTRVRTIFWD